MVASTNRQLNPASSASSPAPATPVASGGGANVRGMSYADGAAYLSPGGAGDPAGPPVQMMRASTGGRVGVVQGKFTDKLQTMPYAEIHAKLVERYLAVPPLWKVSQLARDEGSYASIEEVAAKLGLKPKPDAPKDGKDAAPPATAAAAPTTSDKPASAAAEKPASAPTDKPPAVGAPGNGERKAPQPPASNAPGGAQALGAADKPAAARPPEPTAAQPHAAPPSSGAASAPKDQKTPAAEDTKAPAADGKFVVHKVGLCDYDTMYMAETGGKPVGLTRLYDDKGTERFVCEANLAFALPHCGWTVKPPAKAKKLHYNAKAVSASQGLAQMFTCDECGGLADAGDGCDWVPHDKALGGCGANNIIAGGDSHSRLNEAFRGAMRRVRESDNQGQIVRTLGAHPKAATFWGLGDIATIIATPGRWKSIKDGAMFVHPDFTGFAAAMDKIAK
ncbi:MAG: hypothetical protein U1F43_27045 [Myxococcota bacterium]